MKFLDKDFLLTTDAAKTLYHNYAENMPILDYHCHISPMEIATNKKFDNITQLWLGGDHYKWRQMRSNGVSEKYITGDASDYEKFEMWAKTLEKAIGNPLYHWSHLELQRYFGYEGVLNSKTCKEVWDLCNEKLKNTSCRQLIKDSNVTLICTTDDPADSLEWHEKIAADDSFDVQVLPAWRPDKATNIEKVDFIEYLDKLGKVSGVDIRSFADIVKALSIRLDFFEKHGANVSDHGLDYVPYAPVNIEETEKIFAKRLAGEKLTQAEIDGYKYMLLKELAKEYHKRNWVMQLHFGCKRDNNTSMFAKIGPDTGFDCIGDQCSTAAISNFLNSLAETDELPKTILYSLNPNDNSALGTIIGCFQNDEARGKIQLGSAWWFNDHKTGITNQLTDLANLGLLGNFIGMLTDSRSFISYARHEYFRRILCGLLGQWIENGELPEDYDYIGGIVEDISYNNAVRYFGFNL
ncbi:glucuronate isomerase [Butyrivibrio sp. NC3005]|uniref:glucuronate isomerase n=1 Tax=Butyrivibrio sp. NC3005 TaxID=1280685 RepID=UPI0004084BAA|nr:glucuronate isomerase [Butyrivibrio sp. NC3005]